MNKSKVAFNIADDIYTFNSKYIKLKSKLKNQQITQQQFTNAQYVLMCKVAYLKDVIDKLSNYGYKFARYEKEMCVLQDLVEDITESFNIEELSSLSIKESFSICTYLSKYEDVCDIENEFYEELKEKVANN